MDGFPNREENEMRNAYIHPFPPPSLVSPSPSIDPSLSLDYLSFYPSLLNILSLLDHADIPNCKLVNCRLYDVIVNNPRHIQKNKICFEFRISCDSYQLQSVIVGVAGTTFPLLVILLREDGTVFLHTISLPLIQYFRQNGIEFLFYTVPILRCAATLSLVPHGIYISPATPHLIRTLFSLLCRRYTVFTVTVRSAAGVETGAAREEEDYLGMFANVVRVSQKLAVAMTEIGNQWPGMELFYRALRSDMIALPSDDMRHFVPEHCYRKLLFALREDIHKAVVELLKKWDAGMCNILCTSVFMSSTNLVHTSEIVRREISSETWWKMVCLESSRDDKEFLNMEFRRRHDERLLMLKLVQYEIEGYSFAKAVLEENS